MRRREFITLVGGAAAWPMVARAQQVETLKKIGVLIGTFEANDPLAEPELSALRTELQRLGWREGANLKIEYRWGVGEIDRIQILAKELIDLEPDLFADEVIE
jgi:putative ABC transport system substrate-binding protein